MKHYCIILTLLIISCGTLSAPPVAETDPLKKFIMKCAADIERAKKVVIDRDLVKILTHLQSMDSGGKKYYLLEKESITGMLESVTTGVYADIILVNRDGRVVYTRNSDDIFSRNARQLTGTPLAECYENRETSTLYTGAGRLPSDPGKNCIAFSSKVSGGATMPGVFLVIIDAGKIQEIIGSDDVVLNSGGSYLVTPEKGKIRTRYEYFEKIMLPAGGESGSFIGPSGGRGTFRQVKYGSLSWILVSGR